MEFDVKEKARDKIWSKLITTQNEVKRLQNDVDNGNIGSLTIEQLQGVLEQARSDNVIYSYIFSLMEKNY